MRLKSKSSSRWKQPLAAELLLIVLDFLYLCSHALAVSFSTMPLDSCHTLQACPVAANACMLLLCLQHSSRRVLWWIQQETRSCDCNLPLCRSFQTGPLSHVAFAWYRAWREGTQAVHHGFGSTSISTFIVLWYHFIVSWCSREDGSCRVLGQIVASTHKLQSLS